MTKQTSPLTKSILTGEGILVYVVNVALAIAASIPDTITWTHAGIFITITDCSPANQPHRPQDQGDSGRASATRSRTSSP
jgi:hypothetical protein